VPLKVKAAEAAPKRKNFPSILIIPPFVFGEGVSLPLSGSKHG